MKYNIFKEILKNFPEPNVQIIPNDKKDEKISNQLSKLIKYYIVKNRLNKK